MVTITDISALEYMSRGGLLVGLPIAEGLAHGSWSTSSASDVRRAANAVDFLGISQEHPLHVLVNLPKNRVRSEVMVSHVWEGPMPARSLYQLEDGVLLASPGLCLAQMSIGRSLAQTAAIGMELCGNYGTAETERGFLDRKPLATSQSLQSYLKTLGNHYGLSKARSSCGFILPNSNSPMETVCALLFTLPWAEGGCAFPRPQMNVRIEPPPRLVALSSQRWFEADLCWPDLGVVVEYNSKQNHLDERSQDRDSAKADTLRALGWDVHWITAGRLTEPASREILIAQMAQALGQEPPPIDYAPRRSELVMSLMGRHVRQRGARRPSDSPWLAG